MPFCSACGAPVIGEDRFCTACGSPVRSPAAPPPPVVPQPAVKPAAPPQERVRAIIPMLKRSRLLGQDLFTLVVTDRRCIFARLAPELLKEAARAAAEQAKGAGKGFLARWGAQMEATHQFHLRYQEMEPDRILAETEGNFALEISSLGSVDIQEVVRSEKRGQKTQRVAAWQIEFHAGGGSHRFDVDEDPSPLLMEVLGSLVR